MVKQKVIALLNKLEDPKNPLLGPNMKILYLYGLWQTNETVLRNKIFNFAHCTTLIFILTQFIDLYFQLDDTNNALNNLSVTCSGTICAAKCFSYVLRQTEWQLLVSEISTEEIAELKKGDVKVIKKMKEYTLYSRIVTYSFVLLVLVTNIILVMSPLMKLFTSSTYRLQIKSGSEGYPQIVGSWFPFDNTRMPGYAFASAVQIIMSFQGTGVLSAHDTIAITIMTFIKGQMEILRAKCVALFNGNENRQEIVNKIKECHRHHCFLIRQSDLLDSLLSPVMFLYVLVCSLCICCSVVQFSSKDATAAQKFWAIQFTIAQIAQLFFFCWHGNEVFVESLNLDQGVFESDWWQGDVKLRKQLILLAGKLNHPIMYSAGPFSKLVLPTFINIIKGSYSFFTLFTQMEEVQEIS